jgi:predicted transcriptional regulator
MKRTTVFLEEDVENDLRALSRRQRRPVGALIREALARHVAAEKGKLVLSFLAVGRSGRRDTAERHEELLFGGARQKARRSRRATR